MRPPTHIPPVSASACKTLLYKILVLQATLYFCPDEIAVPWNCQSLIIAIGIGSTLLESLMSLRVLTFWYFKGQVRGPPDYRFQSGIVNGDYKRLAVPRHCYISRRDRNKMYVLNSNFFLNKYRPSNVFKC